jgi:hypothetical protein
MISYPTLGQRVQVHYAARYAKSMPLHGRVGRVIYVCRGRPRNHGVQIDGRAYSIPAGNLRCPEGCP